MSGLLSLVNLKPSTATGPLLVVAVWLLMTAVAAALIVFAVGYFYRVRPRGDLRTLRRRGFDVLFSAEAEDRSRIKNGQK